MFQQGIDERHTVPGTSFEYYGGEDFGYLKLHRNTWAEMVDRAEPIVRLHGYEYPYEMLIECDRVYELVTRKEYRATRKGRNKKCLPY